MSDVYLVRFLMSSALLCVNLWIKMNKQKPVIIIGVIIIILLIFLILQNQQKNWISKSEAEGIAYNFVVGITDQAPTIMNSYKEGEYWKVLVSNLGYSFRDVSSLGDRVLFEINGKTGKVEYLIGAGDILRGERISIEDFGKPIEHQYKVVGSYYPLD
jgi:hypothetical protein